jgi:hypothetical protein
MLKAAGQDCLFRGNRVVLASDESRSVTLQQVTQVANVGRHGITLLPGVRAGLETSAYFAPERAAYTSGTHAVVVEVDPETGKTEILKYVIGHDCGTVINPLLVDGQVLGGFAAGIGNAMYEEQLYDDAAQPLTTSYLDFSLPSAVEVPPVELFHVHSPSPLNPLGAKGAGEGGTIPAPAAIANAVEDALRPFGARINEIPVTRPRSSPPSRATAPRPTEASHHAPGQHLQASRAARRGAAGDTRLPGHRPLRARRDAGRPGGRRHDRAPAAQAGLGRHQLPGQGHRDQPGRGHAPPPAGGGGPGGRR